MACHWACRKVNPYQPTNDAHSHHKNLLVLHKPIRILYGGFHARHYIYFNTWFLSFGPACMMTVNKTWFTHKQWMYTTDTDYCRTVDPSYVLACLSEGAAGSSFLVGTTLSCSLCSGSHDIQSGSRDCSRNFSLETALSKTATSEKPNIEPVQNEARMR